MTSRKAFFTELFARNFFNGAKYLIHYLLDYKLPTFEYINYIVGGAVALRVALTHTYLVRTRRLRQYAADHAMHAETFIILSNPNSSFA